MKDTMPASSPPNSAPSPASIHVAEPPEDAHYYELLDPAGKVRAGLTVILDEQTRAVRAEFCYYERYEVSEAVQGALYNSAKEIVETRYLGGNGLNSPLVVLDGGLLDETELQHRNPDPIYQPEPRYRLWHFVAGYGALLLVLLVIGVLNRTVLKPTPAIVDLAGGAAAPAAMRSEPLPTDEGAAVTAEFATADGLSAPEMQPNTNGLPVSQNANDTLAVGMQVKISQGLRSFLRSLPGPEAGQEIGFLQDGATATILAGPTWLEGDSDTIVWWYVETADGTRGWTPANTSQFTLLEPVAPAP